MEFNFECTGNWGYFGPVIDALVVLATYASVYLRSRK